MIDKTPTSTSKPTPKPAPKPAPKAEPKKPAAAAPAKPASSSSTPAKSTQPGSTAQLARKPGAGANSDPAAASEVTGRQSRTAQGMTGRDKPSAFDQLAGKDKANGLTTPWTEQARAFVEHKEQQEHEAKDARHEAREQTEPHPPKGFREGDKMAAPPNLEKEKPSRQETRPNGDKEETFKVDGQTYTRVIKENGTTTTSYDIDGVSHKDTEYSDGRSSQQIRTGEEDDQHTRIIERDSAGHLSRESYSHQGKDSTFARVTDHNPNGTSSTRTDRTYSVDANLENLAEAPTVPKAASDVVDLPAGGRGKTQVHESEVISTGANGKHRLQGRETSFTQTSTEVQSSEPGAQVSRTVTTSQGRDEDGKPARTVSGSQTLSVPSENGGTTRLTDSWNSKGESTQRFSRSKLSTDDVDDLKDRAEDKKKGELDDGPSVTVGGRTVFLAPPGGDGGLDRGRANDWLKDSPNRETLDLDVTVRRNAEGETVGKTTSFSALDGKGNGRTATRTWAPKTDPDGQDPVEWSYTKFSNNGRDYDRQTAYESSSVSTFETHRETGPGQFRHTSESRDGDNVIANSSAERSQVRDLSELKNRLPADQIDRLRAAGPPYFVETTSASTQLWKDKDGKILRGEDDKPLQTASVTQTLTVRNREGVALTENMRDIADEHGNSQRETLSAVTDPRAEVPYKATIEKGSTAVGTCEYVMSDRSKVTIDRKGRVEIDGEPAAKLNNLGASDFNEQLLKDPNAGIDALAALTNITGSTGVADNTAKAGKQYIDAQYKHYGFDAPDYPKLKVLSGGAGILSLTSGAADIFKGFQEGGVDGAVKVVGGAGGIAGGLEGAALTASLLPGRAGSFASTATEFLGSGTATKFLGRASGVASVVVGGYDLFTGDSTQKRVAGGLTAASGGLFIAAAASSGTIVGAPAGVVLAGAGVVTGAAGLIVGLFAPDESPAPKIDSRLGDS